MNVRKLIFSVAVVVMVLLAGRPSRAQEYVTCYPGKSDGVYTLLKRYNLPTTAEMIDQFWSLNSDLVKGGRYLKLGFAYRMPIYKVYYDGSSIRSTLKMKDLALAKKIERYNHKVLSAGLQKAAYQKSRELWVPADWLTEVSAAEEPASFSIFGPRYQAVDMVDQVLKNCYFYLDPGHGGPDPGAIGKRGNDRLYEDEYAYDITLRLARRLLEHGASVFMIVQDDDDGIRDDAILPHDDHEYYLGGKAISSDHLRRLSDRVDIVNALYDRYRARARAQIMVTIHVDSRSHSKRIDIFYYYQSSDAASRALAKTLLKKIDAKYAENQPGRGYSGTISTRSLHVLNEAKPTAVYIELGNIKNKKDQDRFIIADNRQAVANWLCEGLMEAMR